MVLLYDKQVGTSEKVRSMEEEHGRIFLARRALGKVRVTARPWDGASEHERAPLPPGHKRVSFIRHGEGFHNVAKQQWNEQGLAGEPYTLENDPNMKYLDPSLTETGIQQAKDLQPVAAELCSWRNGPPVELIITSSMRRATQTALIAFEEAIANGMPVLAHDLCHETAGKHTCDKRLSVSQLSKEFLPVVYRSSLLGGEEDPYWGDGRTREPLPVVALRASQFIDWLMELPASSIVVATHSSWLLALMNAAMDVADPATRSWFGTGELRTVVLQPLREDPNPMPGFQSLAPTLDGLATLQASRARGRGKKRLGADVKNTAPKKKPAART